MGLVDNMFENNYAYFSGGAIYMNLPQDLLPIEKKLSSILHIYMIYLVPIFLKNNTFKGNNLWKMSNGGAMTIRGRIVSSTDIDIETRGFALSEFTPTYIGSQNILSDLPTDPLFYLSLFITNCSFLQNMSGYKGTALLIHDIPHIYIHNTLFAHNKPMLWGYRHLNYYYTKYANGEVDEQNDQEFFLLMQKATVTSA